LQNTLYLGNIDAKRDWGHAKDYVEAMYLMLQQEQAEDFVIATGITTSVRDFIRKAFFELGLELEFSGSGRNEKGVLIGFDDARLQSLRIPIDHLEIGKTLIKVDPEYYRPTEVDLLVGDPKKAHAKLGWQPKYDLDALIKDMVESDLRYMQRDKYLADGGHKIHNYFE